MNNNTHIVQYTLCFLKKTNAQKPHLEGLKEGFCRKNLNKHLKDIYLFSI